MLLGMVREAGLEDRVTSNLTEVTAGQFEYLGSDGVLFH